MKEHHGPRIPQAPGAVPHIHDRFQCFPHIRDCDCEDKPNMICNPYYVSGHCPDYLEEEPNGVELTTIPQGKEVKA